MIPAMKAGTDRNADIDLHHDDLLWAESEHQGTR